MTNLTLPIFTDANKAREHLEAIRWPEGPICPHCGVVAQATLVKGKSHRPGLYQCNACREPFSVTVGTVMEKSHIPLNKWVLGFHLMASGKKGISAHQLHRQLGVTYKSAWFMAHRIREAMAPTESAPMGAGGGGVEADETFIGRKAGAKVKAAYHHKMKVLTLVDRETKRARSTVLKDLTSESINPVLLANISVNARLMTDEAGHYNHIGRKFAKHAVVNHGLGEYVNRDGSTNTVEGFFSVFKRGMKGTYQHCGEQHLHRYLAEFDFRYCNRTAAGVNDTVRAEKAMKASEGKRLTYRAVTE
jgi:transposase-like protein